MKKLTVLLMSALVLGAVQATYAAEQQDYASTIQVFKSDPVVAKFFSDSYGYAVFPTIAKAGFVVGGSYGEGQVYQGGKVTGTAKLIEGSIGWQFGGQAFSEIIFFQDKRAYDEFTSGNFEFSAGAEAVAITAGAQAQAGTAGSSAGASAGPKTGVQAETGYYKGIATFVHAKGGLMAGVSVAGQKFTFEPL
ncbi:MAG TPA: lipid-binding SYLF domain-containing protein [Desulfobacterales bacterium]|jgi:lipid-binding SYLF domain-containing protein|nr:lipid-binding SYLF domain-containing protein [Desulfobacterales bacterium]